MIFVGILIGILIGFGLFAIVELNYKAIKVLMENKNAQKKEETVQKQEISEEELEKIEKTRKHFENLMGYEYETALKKE